MSTSSAYPGKISRNILSSMVVPVGRGTPAVDELANRFAEDSPKLYRLVRDPLDAPRPKPEPTVANTVGAL